MMKPAIAALLLITAPAMAAENKPVTIQTPSGEITFKEVAIPNQDSFKDTITELTQDEHTALKRDTERVPSFIAAFVPPELRKGDVLEDLDLAFTAWLKSGKRDAFPSKDVIRIVGCGIGAYAIQHLGVRWARIKDAYGSDIALVADEPMTRSYPFTSVQYRIEDGKTDFIVALFRSLEHIMKENSK